MRLHAHSSMICPRLTRIHMNIGIGGGIGIGIKILLAALSAVAITALGAFITVRVLAAKNRVQAIHDGMSTILQQAEQVASTMDLMHRAKVFDLEKVSKRAHEQIGGRRLMEATATPISTKSCPLSSHGNQLKKPPPRKAMTSSSPPRRDTRRAIPPTT